ncbi:MAG TPA: glycosyltransferase family 2 protein [Gemmatimonadales bacterium]|nr:glycosyltransferase family 2 protein [Gemmatimonadales bacterium]
MRLSVAIPLHNEGQVLPELLDRLRATLDALPEGPHEMIFVDDGSRDATMDLLQQAAHADPRIVVVSLSRNFGHQAALTAALDQVSGDAVVVMDGDLQDAPEDIPRLLARLEEGFDVVYARRVRRKERWLLRVAYFVFYRLIASLSKLKLPVDAGDFGVMSRRVVDEIRRAPEHNRYLRGLRTWVGFRQTGLELERAERFAGRSKYSVRALIRLAFDGIFAFSIAPLRAAAVLGAFAVLIAALFALYAVYARVVLDRSPQGFTSLIVVMTFLSGMNLFFLGMIGEYVGRVYEEAKARPLYVIDKLIREGHDRRTGRERRTGPR